MNRTFFLKKLIVVAVAVIGTLSAPSSVFATASVTTLASASISADTTGGSYTILTGPVVSESARDFPSSGTFILNPPPGFIFNTNTTVSSSIIKISGSGTCFSFTSTTATPTSSTITYTLNARDSNTTTPCKVTFSNIQVRPSAGTLLATGNITKSGTATVVGITNGSTNFGTLTEIVGAKNKLAFTTQPSSSVTVNTDFATKPVVKLQDQFGNTVTTDSASIISRAAVLSGQACGGTAGNGTITSIPANGASVSSGVMMYTAMQYSVGEAIQICASSVGVTSALSNSVTVNKITTSTTIGTSLTPQVYGSTVTFTAIVTPTSGSVPSGTVTFKDGITTIGTGTLNGATPGVATYATTSLSVAGSPHSITAVYNGDSVFSGSTSSAISQTITAKNLTVTGITANNKVYDTFTTATLNTGSAVLVGIVDSDNVTLNTGSVSALFSSKTIGVGKTVTVSGLTLSGTAAGNYTLTQPTGITANIMAANLIITGMTATNKVYDSFTTATLSGGTLVGVISPDVVSINTRTGNFADKNVGVGKAIIVTAITLTGADAGNYTVTLPTGITANITALGLVVTGITATNKAYDGNRTAALNTGSATLVGVISPDAVTLNTGSAAGLFDTKNVGTGKTVTISGLTLLGTDAANYTLTQPAATANITAFNLTVTGITANNKVFDGNQTATLNTAGATLVGVISPDVVTLNTGSAVGTFDNANVGTGKIVTISGMTLSGTDAPNYTLTQPSTTANINNPVPVTSNISPTSKNVGDTDFSLTLNGSNFLSSSVVNFNGSARATTFVNAGQLIATITTADMSVPTSNVFITVTNPGPGGGTSNAQIFSVIFSATQFVILAPSAGSVDASSTVTVQAQKSNGSIDTSYQNDVTLNMSGSATGGGLVNIVNGVGTLSIHDTVAETSHLSLTDSQGTGLAVISTQDLVFVPGVVTQFTLNNPGNMNARSRLGYLLTRKDQYGNSVLAGTLSAYLYTTSTSTAHTFYDDSLAGNSITSSSFTNGSATSNFWYYDEAPGTYTITTSDNSSAPDAAIGITDATRSVTVIPVAVKFTIIAATSTSVDSPLVVTVQAQKSDNSVDTNFQTSVTLNASGSATGAGVISIVNGVGTKNVSDRFAETVHLSLTDSQSAGLDISSIADVIWHGGATTQFSLNHPGTLSAGNRAAYTVSRKDQYGNSTSQGAVTVYLYSSSFGVNKKFYDAATAGNVITSMVIPDGQQSGSFWYYDEKPGSWSITASDNASAPDGATGISDAVDVLSVVSGAVSSFTLNNPGNMTAKTRLGYTVTRKDQFGNLVTVGDSTIYLYTTAGALGMTRFFYDAATLGNSISSVVISNGASQASFWYYEESSGSFVVTGSDSSSAPDGATGIVDGTQNITVTPAPIVATRFVILDPTDGTVDAPITVTIQAQDNAGDLDTSATSSVTLVTSGSATGAGIVTMIGGVGTIQISDHTAETVQLSLFDSAGTGLGVSSTQNVVFSAGTVSQFSIDNPGDIGAGSRIGFTITRKDQYGNLITTGVTNANLDSSSAGVNKKFYDLSSGGSVITSVNILNGQSTAQFWYYDELAGGVTITVSGGAGITQVQRIFNVTPAAIVKFTIDNPGNMTAGTRLEYTLTRKDSFDNLVTSGIVSAYLYSTATGTSTKFYDAASGGIQTNVAAFADGNSEAHFWYFEESPGTWVITASDGTPIPNGATGLADAADSVTVTLATISATRFVIQPVNNSTVGIPVTVTIRAEDESGNVDATYNHTVTLVTSGSATGGGIISIVNGVGTAIISDVVAEPVVLLLLDSQTTGLNISSLRTMLFSAVFIPSAAERPSAPSIEQPAPIISGVRLTGRAFPGALLNIVAIGGTDTLQNQKGTAAANGSFTLNFSGLTGGARSYGIIGTDINNNTTQVKIFDANMVNKLLQLDVNGILLSPTIGLTRSAITKGDVLGINGAGVPAYMIEIQVDNQPTTITTTVDSKGFYKAIVPTAGLDIGSHTIRTRQIGSTGLKSDYSPQEVFSVVNIFTPNMDFNSDGSIGIQDYSIFISRWQSPDPKLRARDDMNGDGKVDVQDFSIFVRTLKIK